MTTFFNKNLVILFLSILLIGCSKDTDTPPEDEVIEINGNPFLPSNSYAVKNDSRLAIVMENELNDRLEIKLKNLPDNAQGYFPLSKESNINYFDNQNQKAYSTAIGNSFFTGDSISIIQYDINQKIITGNFNGKVYHTVVNDFMSIENGDFDFQFEESFLQDNFTASLNGDALNIDSDSISFFTEYSNGSIIISANHGGHISFSVPFDIQEGEYDLPPLIPNTNPTVGAIQGVIFLPGVNSFTLIGKLNITSHIPTERKIKGNATIENSDDIIQIDFEGFYF